MPNFKEEKADDKQISTILFKHVHVIYIYDIYNCAFNGVLYLHWACIQQVIYMGVDDRVFVPLSDVYMVKSTFLLLVGCLCLYKVTCLYVCLS